MKEDVTAEIDFSLSNELTTEKEFTSEDIQTISLFDEVFKVEDDYEAYQVAQSVPRRAVLANNAMQLAVDSFNNGNIATKEHFACDDDDYVFYRCSRRYFCWQVYNVRGTACI